MKVTSMFSIAVAVWAMTIISCVTVLAQEDATTDEIYELILKALPVIEELGDEGLPAFNDPKGEFVYKGAYVYVIDCATMTMAAHPAKQLVGANLSNMKDKNPDPAKIKKHTYELCELSKRPNGGWVEYYWTKPDSDEVARKIGFVIGVPGTSYALTSSIYDETTDIKKLNATLE